MNKLKSYAGLLCLLILAALNACNTDYQPKPKAYFRIDFPEKTYRTLDSIYPYSFKIPSYAVVTSDPYAPEQKNWINIGFPDYQGQLHISYKEIDGNLMKYMEDSRTMAFKHIPKASSIESNLILNPDSKVYGLTYEINGMGAASPYQFFVTDSTKHFIRGALYFNMVPNNDSLAPIIDFLKQDIEYLIQSLKWK